MRVVLHCHSIWSYDGVWSLAAIARLMGRLGVDAVMMTEHDTGFSPDRFAAYRDACAAVSTERCQLIPGIEYSSPDNDIHILTWGLETFLTEHRPVAETLERVTEAGGAAVFAHPVRRDAFARFDPAWVPHLSAIELWNRKSDGLVWGTEAARLVADTGLPATVGMDFHRARHLYPLDHLAKIPRDADPETALVAALRDERLTPRAFRRPLRDSDGTLRPGPHIRLETLRRAALRRLRG